MQPHPPVIPSTGAVSHRRLASSTGPLGSRVARRRPAGAQRRALARYLDHRGVAREVVARQGFAGSVLVIDRDAATLGDRRLLAHLSADEPAENAALVCSDYLERGQAGGCSCRALRDEDARVAPPPEAQDLTCGEAEAPAPPPVEAGGSIYTLERTWSRMAIAELRWCRRCAHAPEDRAPVSLREVIANLESYEPVRSATVHALARHRGDAQVSTTTLRAELGRVLDSPIVLNRGLREAVLGAVEREQLSLSEIAIRCGRIKRDRNGKESGETSWLARRLGLLPEGGQLTPTPWVHSDVLALIARDGVGVAPREVELG
jgi:hypothetical protein